MNIDDTPENAERLFGEPIHLPDGEHTFLGYGLFNRFHKQVLTEDALWCLLIRAGFYHSISLSEWTEIGVVHAPIDAIRPVLNRRHFSLEMIGVK